MRSALNGPLKLEAEFFRKSNNLTVTREKKIRSIQVRSFHMVLLLAAGLLAGLLLSRAANLLLTCEALQVRHFRLRQQPVFARERVAAILSRHQGSILALDLRRLRSQLLAVPEIAQVAIRRVLPDTVDVDLTLRRPFFCQSVASGWRLLDAAGLELGRVAGRPQGLVPLRASSPAAVAAVAANAGELQGLRARIEYVAYDPLRGLELKLHDAPETFYPGEGGYMAKIRLYARIQERLALAAAAVRCVDLRIPGRVYIEFAESQRGNP